MSFKTILVPISSPEASESSLDCALLVAQRSGGHIEAMHVRADPRGLVPYTGEGMDGSMIEEIMDVTEREGAERAEETRQMFDDFCSAHSLRISDTPEPDAGVTISRCEVTGREDEVIALRGRLYDLIVVGRPIADRPLPSPITLEAALHDTGRPILVAPPQSPGALGKHIAIAWEASPEAARTIAVSISALASAEKVSILAPRPPAPQLLDPEELVLRLAWHKISASVQWFESPLSELGAAFLAQSNAVGADLLVKGAYSQSRLRQMVLGGRTRHILANASIPVLLAK